MKDKRTSVALSCAALALVAGIATSCNLQWSPYAAKVGTKVITPSELDTALNRTGNDAGFTCLLENSNPLSGYRVKGAGTSTYDSGFAAFVLTDLIQAQVAHDLVSEEGLLEPAVARQLASEQVKGALKSEESEAGCTSGVGRSFRALGTEMRSVFVGLQLDEDTLSARAAHVSISDESLEGYEHSHPSVTKETCLLGIFAKTKSEANTIYAASNKKTSFSSLVSRYASTSTSTGGQLGCYTTSQLLQISPAIESSVYKAAIGTVQAPVYYESSSQSAYLVTEVSSRPFEPVVDLLNQLFTDYSSKFGKEIAAHGERLGVQVNPRYGAWSESSKAVATGVSSGIGGQVVPPKGPSLSYVLDKGAVSGKLHQLIESTSGGS